MNSKDNMLFFIAGAAVGAAAAVLYAPRSGEETRAYLKSKAEEGGDYIEEARGAAMRSVKDKVERVKKTANNVIDRTGLKDTVDQAVEVGKQAYRDAQEGTLETNGAKRGRSSLEIV